MTFPDLLRPAAALLLVCWAAGAAAGGGRFWALNLFTHGTPLGFGAAALLALAGLGLQDPSTALLGAVGALLFGARIFKTRRSSDAAGARSAAGEAPEISLYAHNVLYKNLDVEAIRAGIREADADVVMLLETTMEHAEALGDLGGSYPYGAHRAEPGGRGLSLLSKRPLQSFRSWRPEGDPHAVIEADLVLDGGRRVRLVAVHTPCPIDALRHQAFERHLDALARRLRAVPGDVVAAGDWNATPWCRSFRAFLDAANLELGLRLPPGTYPARSPLRLPIDHVLVRPGMTLRDLRVGAARGSDHLPLAARARCSVSASGAAERANLAEAAD